MEIALDKILYALVIMLYIWGENDMDVVKVTPK